MLKRLGRSVRDFRATYKKHLIFESLFMLLTSFAIIPILSFIFNRMLRVIGSGSILNGEVYKIGLSYSGIAIMIFICLVAVLVLFIEFGVVIIISQQHYFGKEIMISDAVLTTLRQTPKIFGLGMIQLLFFVLFLVPFIESPFSTYLYAQFNVPIFWNSRVTSSSMLTLVLIGILFLVGVYIILRWIFVLHFIMIENKTVREAIKSSLMLTRGKRFSLFFQLFLLNSFVFISGFIVISSVAYLPSWIDNNVLKAFSDQYSLTLTTVLTYMYALLLVPINIIFITRLFYYFNRISGIMPKDRLHLYKNSWFSPLEQKLTIYLKGRTRIFSSILAVYLALALFVSYAASDQFVYVKWNVLLSAHRGDSLAAPENSLEAVRSSIEQGVDAVEVDVQLTKDGIVVLHHDYNLQRMAGISKRVNELTYEQIAKLNINQNGDVAGTGEIIGIPMLSEVLAEVQGKSKLIIDLKPHGSGEQLASQVVSLIEQFGMTEECYIQSFDRQNAAANQNVERRNQDRSNLIFCNR